MIYLKLSTCTGLCSKSDSTGCATLPHKRRDPARVLKRLFEPHRKWLNYNENNMRIRRTDETDVGHVLLLVLRKKNWILYILYSLHTTMCNKHCTWTAETRHRLACKLWGTEGSWVVRNLQSFCLSINSCSALKQQSHATEAEAVTYPEITHQYACGNGLKFTRHCRVRPSVSAFSFSTAGY